MQDSMNSIIGVVVRSVKPEHRLQLGLRTGLRVHDELEDVRHVCVPVVDDRAFRLRSFRERDALFAIVVAERRMLRNGQRPAHSETIGKAPRHRGDDACGAFLWKGK